MSSEAFQKAQYEVFGLKSKPSQDQQLELYALKKQADQSPPFSDAPKPGMFDLKRKAMYNKWQSIAEESSDSYVSPDAAKEKYIALVEKLKSELGYDEEQAKTESEKKK